jgi:hypothetical protein
MFPVLPKELQVEIDGLHRQDQGIREIARADGVSRNTVRALLRGEHDGQYGRRSPRPTKLHLFKEYVEDRLFRAGKETLRATVLLREIRAQGYAGGITQLKEHIVTRSAIADRLCSLPARIIATARFYRRAWLLTICICRVHRPRANRNISALHRSRLGGLWRRSAAYSVRQSEDDRHRVQCLRR